MIPPSPCDGPVLPLELLLLVVVPLLEPPLDARPLEPPPLETPAPLDPLLSALPPLDPLVDPLELVSPEPPLPPPGVKTLPNPGLCWLELQAQAKTQNHAARGLSRIQSIALLIILSVGFGDFETSLTSLAIPPPTTLRSLLRPARKTRQI
jgi:hypothetical protein